MLESTDTQWWSLFTSSILSRFSLLTAAFVFPFRDILVGGDLFREEEAIGAPEIHG
jgi:hypothetical protein